MHIYVHFIMMQKEGTTNTNGLYYKIKWKFEGTFR